MIPYGERLDYVISKNGKMIQVAGGIYDHEMSSDPSHKDVYYGDKELDKVVEKYLKHVGQLDKDDTILIDLWDIKDLTCSMNLYDYDTLKYIRDQKSSFMILFSFISGSSSEKLSYTDYDEGFGFEDNKYIYIYDKKMKKFFYLRKNEDKEFTQFLIYKALFLRKNTLLTILAYIYLKNSRHKFKLYRHFTIPKKNGKKRDIYAINPELKPFLKYLSYDLYDRLDRRINGGNPFTTDNGTMMGYMRNRNIILNAKYHKDNKRVIKFDVNKMFDNLNLDFFNKIKSNRKTLYGAQFELITLNDTKNKYYRFRENELKNTMYEKWRNKFAADYMNEILVNPRTNGLYMGNPCSPVLANIIILPVFNHIRHMVNKKGIRCTIYADDLTFSGKPDNKFLSKKYLSDTIETAIKKADEVYKSSPYKRLTINKSKTVTMNDQRRRITGIRINHRNETTSGQKAYRLLRSILFNVRMRKSFDVQRDTEFDSLSQLMGNINFWRDEEDSDRIDKLLDKYHDEWRIIIQSENKNGGAK